MIEITNVANRTLFIRKRGNKLDIADWSFGGSEVFGQNIRLRMRSSGETRLRRKYKKLAVGIRDDLKKGLHVEAFRKVETLLEALEDEREDI